MGITVGAPAINNAVGYQARYIEYKTRLNEVHGLFQSGKSLQSWCSPRVGISNTFNTNTWLYVRPSVTDKLFALSYDGSQVSDPFMCHFKYNARIVRNMGVHGIPTF